MLFKLWFNGKILLTAASQTERIIEQTLDNLLQFLGQLLVYLLTLYQSFVGLIH